MGGTYSDLEAERYKWSSEEFPQETALKYTPVSDKSKFSIFRLSVRPEKVLLRLADTLCHDHPVRLHMELTAERHNGYFNPRLVRVVVEGVNTLSDLDVNALGAHTHFSYSCVSRSCNYHVSKGESFFGNFFGSVVSDMTWEVFHTYELSMKTLLRFYVNIECHKVTGLSAMFRGPFKFKVPAFVTESMIQRSTPVIQREVNGEPPKAINAFLESEFTGKQYILFQQEGKLGNSSTTQVVSGQGARVIVNTDGNFHGNGNGSKYQNCSIVMNYEAAKGTN